jgi:hypothetical protein
MNLKLLYGVGVNDADYVVQIKSKGWVCPYYQRWANMLKRCYSDTDHKANPTYVGCTVCKDWELFSNFRNWVIERGNVEGWQLDKDLLCRGERIYSPDTCTFISGRLNTLLSDSRAIRGEFPLGVTYDHKNKKYRAKCKLHGKTIHLGRFNTALEAHLAWQKEKILRILESIDFYIKESNERKCFDFRVVEALNKRLKMIELDILEARETKILNVTGESI